MYALKVVVKTSKTKIKSFSTQIKINTILPILFPGTKFAKKQTSRWS